MEFWGIFDWPLNAATQICHSNTKMIPLGRAARLLAGLRPGNIPIQCNTIVPYLTTLDHAAWYTAIAMPDTHESNAKQPDPVPRHRPKLDRRPRRTDSHPVILETDQQAWHSLIIPKNVWPVLLTLRAAGALCVLYVCSTATPRTRDLCCGRHRARCGHGQQAKGPRHCDHCHAAPGTMVFVPFPTEGQHPPQIRGLLGQRFRTKIVGQKFPIAIVMVDGHPIEVSSMLSARDPLKQTLVDTKAMLIMSKACLIVGSTVAYPRMTHRVGGEQQAAMQFSCHRGRACAVPMRSSVTSRSTL